MFVEWLGYGADEAGRILGIKPGAGLYSITGLTAYFFGSAQQAPALARLEGGNSEQADAAAALEYSGSGTP